MNTGLPLFAIGLLFGGGIGFTFAAANGFTLNSHDHSDPAHHGQSLPTPDGTMETDLPVGMTMADICTPSDPHGNSTHNHDDILVIEPSETAPTLDLNIVKDPSAGWNLNVQTTNFVFSPQNASSKHIPGEGHAHVYINGTKLGRVYGAWVHLDDLPAGEVAVDVTLNANDHRPLSVGPGKLQARVILQN